MSTRTDIIDHAIELIQEESWQYSCLAMFAAWRCQDLADTPIMQAMQSDYFLFCRANADKLQTRLWWNSTGRWKDHRIAALTAFKETQC